MREDDSHAGRGIYYACTAAPRAGGEMVNLQHVATLRELGWRAFVLLDAGTPLPDGLAREAVVRWGEPLAPWRGDWLVQPEVTPPEQLKRLADMPCRLAIHNQNPYYTFVGVPHIDALNRLGLAGGLCCSAFTRDTLRRWGSTTDWQVVRPALLPCFPNARATRRRQVAFMPRKRPADAAALQVLFRGLFPRWAGVPWVPIEGLSRQQVAGVLAESEVFASFSWTEGLGLPPLEAMAAGSLVCGFDGRGGSEYATPANGLWVADGDLEGFARALDQALSFEPDEAARRVAAGRATAALFTEERFAAQLDAAWRRLLGDEAADFRLAPGEAAPAAARAAA